MVEKTKYTKMVESVVALKMKAVDEYIAEFMDKMGDIGNPEKLIGKPYEQWTELDRQLLWSIYGQEEPNTLSKFIAGKEYELVQELEKEVEL